MGWRPLFQVAIPLHPLREREREREQPRIASHRTWLSPRYRISSPVWTSLATVSCLSPALGDKISPDPFGRRSKASLLFTFRPPSLFRSPSFDIRRDQAQVQATSPRTRSLVTVCPPPQTRLKEMEVTPLKPCQNRPARPELPSDLCSQEPPDSGYLSDSSLASRWCSASTVTGYENGDDGDRDSELFGPVRNLGSILDGSPETLPSTAASDNEDFQIERHIASVFDAKLTPESVAAFASAPARVKQTPATLPKRSVRKRPGLPVGFLSDSRVMYRFQGSKTNSSPRSGSLRQLDRFIPIKKHLSSGIVDQFRSSKPPYELSDLERLLRDDRATADPFFYRPRRPVPMASDYRVLSLSESSALRAGSMFSTPGFGAQNSNRSAVRGTLLGPRTERLPNQNFSLGIRAERQPSNGTVWTVGGVAPSGTAVNNGRGQLMRTGTNAPVFRTSFPATKPKVDNESAKHEDRLASALGLDRIGRLIAVQKDAARGQSLGTSTKRCGDAHHPTRTKSYWNGSELVHDGNLRSKQLGNSPGQ